jgi:16S rRNA G966 N2-methylase RsmD
LEIIYKKNLLSKDGLIVTKIDSSEIIYEGYENLQLCDNRKYGNTTVCFYRYKED